MSADNIIEQITSPLGVQTNPDSTPTKDNDLLYTYVKTQHQIDQTKKQLDVIEAQIDAGQSNPALILGQAINSIQSALESPLISPDQLLGPVVKGQAALNLLAVSNDNDPDRTKAILTLKTSLNQAEKELRSPQPNMDALKISLSSFTKITTSAMAQAPSPLNMTTTSTPTVIKTDSPYSSAALSSFKALYRRALSHPALSNDPEISSTYQGPTLSLTASPPQLPPLTSTVTNSPPSTTATNAPTSTSSGDTDESIQDLINDIIMGKLLNVSGKELNLFIQALNILDEANSLLGPIASLLKSLKNGYTMLPNGKTPHGGNFPASHAWYVLHKAMSKFPLSKMKSLEKQLSSMLNTPGLGSQTKAAFKEVLSRLHQLTHFATQINTDLGSKFIPYRRTSYIDSASLDVHTLVTPQKPAESVFEKIFGSKGLLKSFASAAGNQQDQQLIRGLMQSMQMKVSMYENQYNQLVAMAGQLLSEMQQAMTSIARNIH